MEISTDPNEFLWVQKYRPKTVEECILPQELENTFKAIATGERIPSLLLSGGHGVGKTTVAKALCEQVGVDWMFINGSLENGIDTLRTKISGFASTVSLQDSKKVVIIDEADNLNPNSVQPALRAFSEDYSKNCTFILTCNWEEKIIPPLKSRFTPIKFKIPQNERPLMAARFMKRAEHILSEEGISYDKKVVVELIQQHFPDFRRILNELQRYSASGVIDSGILVTVSDSSFQLLFEALQQKRFNDVRSWVAKNSDITPTELFNVIYHKLSLKLKPQSIPELVLTLAQYQYWSAFAADQEINTMAFLTEIMTKCEWK